MKLRLPRISERFGFVDWWIIAPILFLICIGLVMQYSIGTNLEISTLSPFFDQLTYVAIGVAAFVIFSFIDHRTIKGHAAIYFLFASALLVGVLIFGVTIKGTTGWFVLAGYSLQPVEIAKILFILFIAAYFERSPEQMSTYRYFIISGISASVLVGLVVLQPDLGSALILFVLWFSFAILLRAPKLGLVAVAVMAVGIFLVGWFFLFEDYQKDRLSTFINPEADPMGTGYNITQSIVAIGSGSFWGRGLGLGTQSQLHFLPEVTSDFIFAAIAEELGFISVLGILGSIGMILFRLWVYMSRTKDMYVFLFCFGVFVYFLSQSFLVLGMNMGLLPVTGVPLPLVSAGGTSMVITLLAFGIVHRMGLVSRN
ncbi:MAG: FtsW/RodA/SpoVE family cell cycle protein [Candidatus Kerfeldbacteria bacterium]